MPRRPVILVSAGFPAYGDYMGPALRAGRSRRRARCRSTCRTWRTLERALELADGILMGFGGDIDPARYGGDARTRR